MVAKGMSYGPVSGGNQVVADTNPWAGTEKTWNGGQQGTQG